MSRGRGRGQLSFNAELLGVGRGEAPTSALAPPPKYPPRPGRTIPLLENPEQVRATKQKTRLDSLVTGDLSFRTTFWPWGRSSGCT